MKLRMVRFARIHEYNNLFTGDPVWTTESIGGMGTDGRTLVPKCPSVIYIHWLNLGPAPEPKPHCIVVPLACQSASAASVQTYLLKHLPSNTKTDDLMRPNSGDDYAIACCVSPMRIGKEMQFFGARSNLAKMLALCNQWRRWRKIKRKQIGPKIPPYYFRNT